MAETATESDASEPEEIALTGWTCEPYKKDDTGAWPVLGDYTFAAALPEGYALSGEAASLEITATLGEANMLTQTNADTGNFAVNGDELESGKDYEYNGDTHTLTIKSNKAVTISMKNSGDNPTQDHIVVDGTCTDSNAANITLDNVNIDVSSKSGVCAFEIAGSATCNLTLSGTNALKSGQDKAGLQVQNNQTTTATLNITADSESGSLIVTGGKYGAGIGGSKNNSGGNITINNGNITATGNGVAACIGGGAADNGGTGGAGGTITIHGGKVTAQNPTSGENIGGGAGIGGGQGNSSGAGGSGGVITITDGKVTTTVYSGAGIGGGQGGNLNGNGGTGGSSGTIKITGGTVISSGATGIGGGTGGSSVATATGGTGGSGDSITIEGGEVTALGTYGVGIGGGSGGSAGFRGGNGGNGGTINILDGKVTAIGDYGCVGIGGGVGAYGRNGGAGGNGGTVTISGGIVTATSKTDEDWTTSEGIGGGVGGGTIGGGSAGNAGAAVSLSTGTSGNAIIIADSIDDTTNTNSWSGIIFGGDDNDKTKGEIYGSSPFTLDTDLEIPEGKTLVIGNGKELIVSTGVTVSGMIKTEDGGTVSGSGTVQSPSTVGIKFFKNGSEVDNKSVSYGDTITITATAQKEQPSNTLSRGAAVNYVDFWLGDIDSGEQPNLGTAAVKSDGTASLSVTLTKEDWKPSTSAYTITADFGGTSGTSGLMAKTISDTLTVNKGDKTKPDAPTPSGDATATSITISTVSGQKYLCSTSSSIPSLDGANWKDGNNSTLTFDNLIPQKTYYIWTYIPETDYYNASPVSSSLSVTTGKSGDQTAVENAKAIIESGTYSIEQSTASTENDAINTLASQINNLSGMKDTDITIQASNITIMPSSFQAAKEGDADDADGTDGSFSFTVSLSKGSGNTAGSATTSSRSCTITATAFIGTTNVQAVAAAKTAIEGGTYMMAQATANSEDTVKTELVKQLNALPGMSGTGIAVTADDITIGSDFKAATAGNLSNRNGENGSFSFTVSLRKGNAAAITGSRGGTITATPYKAPGIVTVGLPDGKVGNAYTAKLEADGEAPVSWSITGSLPGGLTLSGDTISGTPTASGDFTFTVQASNSYTPNAEKSLTIKIMDRSANANLSSLSIENVPLSPAFDPDITEYTASVSHGTTGVTITATADDAGAIVSDGTGYKPLTAGENTFPITVTVTAENGDKKNYTITVTRLADSTGDSSGSGTGGSSNSSDRDSNNNNTAATTPSPKEPDTPTTGEIAVSSGEPVTGSQIKNALAQAAAAAKAAGGSGGGNNLAIAISLQDSTASATLDRDALNELISSGIKNFKVNFGGAVSMTFSLNNLKEIVRQSSGAVTFTANKAAVTGEALAAIGTRPAYDLSISYRQDDQTVKLANVGGVSVALSYTPAATEQDGTLYAVYADGDKAVWLDKSSYDRNTKAVLFAAEHFSIYGIGYKTPPVFTDTVDHLAKSDIDFAAVRGLLTETSATTFSPDSPITRGMFAVALGRLAGINPADYAPTGRFTDVPATEHYAPYAEWAASKGIINRTGSQTFEPDQNVTREEMAAIIQNYARVQGDTLPVARKAENFTDAQQIDPNCQAAVQAIWQASIIDNKDNHRFAPKDSATRAEATAVLRRYIEIMIDPTTAQKN